MLLRIRILFEVGIRKSLTFPSGYTVYHVDYTTDFLTHTENRLAYIVYNGKTLL